MTKYLGWISTLAVGFLLYAALALKSLAATTLLQAFTVFGLGWLPFCWLIILIALSRNTEPCVKALIQSCSWPNRLLSSLDLGLEVTTVYLYASLGYPWFTLLAVIATLMTLASWSAREALGRFYAHKAKRKDEIDKLANQLVDGVQSGAINPNDLLDRVVKNN